MNHASRTALLTFVLLAGLVIPVYLGGTEAIANIKSLAPGSAINLVVAMSLLVFANAMRLRILFVGSYPRLTTIAFGRLYLATEFFSKITPGGSGALPAALMLLRRYNVPASSATATFVVSAGLDLVVLAVIMVLAILAMGISLSGAFWSVALIFCALCFMALAIFTVPKLRHCLFSCLSTVRRRSRHRKAPIRWLALAIGFFETFMVNVLSIGWERTSLALFITLAYWLLHLSILYWVVTSMGAFIDWPSSLMIQFTAMGLGYLSLSPGGAGVVEVSAIAGLSSWVSVSMASTIVLVWRLFMQYFYIVVGAAALLIERFVTTNHDTQHDNGDY